MKQYFMDNPQQVIQGLLQTTVFVLCTLVVLFALFSMYLINTLIQNKNVKVIREEPKQDSAAFNMEEITTTTVSEPAKKRWTS